MDIYVTTTISPMMIGDGSTMVIESVNIEDIDRKKSIKNNDNFIGAVGHETTAQVLKPIIKAYFPFVGEIPLYNRINISLKKGDGVLAIIPNFRTEVAREFSLTEVESAGFRAFFAEIID